MALSVCGNPAAVQTAAAACLALITALSWPRTGESSGAGRVTPGSGWFRVDSTVILRVPPRDRDADAAAHYLADLWTRTNELTLPVRPAAARSARRRSSSNASQAVPARGLRHRGHTAADHR